MAQQGKATAVGLSGSQRRFFYVAYSLLALGAAYFMRISPTSLHSGTYFEDISKGGDWYFPGTKVSLRRDYTGVASIDTGLAFLVAAFTPASSGWTPVMRLQLLYFLLNFTAVIATWAVESERTRNSWATITFITVWAVFYQTVGGAIIIPMWYLFYTWTSSSAQYWYKSRELPLARARSLLPALLIGYLVPTLGFAYPFKDIRTIQAVTAFWQPAPMLMNLLWFVFSQLAGPTSTVEQRQRPNADRSYLTSVYAVSGLTGLISHVALIYSCLTAPQDSGVSFANLFIPRIPGELTMSSALHFIFQVDLLGIFVTTSLWCIQVKFELINMGRAPFGSLYAIFSTLAGTIVLGPGAVLCAVAWWREKQIDAVDNTKKLR